MASRIERILLLIEGIVNDQADVRSFRDDLASLPAEDQNAIMEILLAADENPDSMRDAALARGWNVPPGWPLVRARTARPN
jgi:hypothetical protein